MLDDLSYIKNIDKSNMREILERFPEQCKEAIKLGRDMNVTSRIRGDKVDKIVVCGLGGSAIGGDILKTLFSAQKTTIEVNRDYHLPSFVDEKTVVFVVSYSGNTEETIFSFKQALKKSCRIISITSGGKLQRLSEQNSIPSIKIPSGMPPRCCVGFLSIPMIVLLEKILNVDLFDYEELVQVVSEISQRYAPEKKTSENLTKSVALRLKGKIPLIYGINRVTDVAVRRLKTQLNENSKVVASWDVFPEMNHNEIVPFSGEGALELNIFHPLFIRDKGEYQRITQRIKITQGLFEKNEIEYSELWSEGKSLITRIFSSIYTGDWISFYLAIIQGVDPTPVSFIDLLKNELQKI
ncbi:bifunctional phosphoglucose/phosphomannose isomerase [Candidatus Aerophobetes bacterium]|nr:bifunctional phosphoglucose/phosphomannose isomerase [Candidatus Aerophobetes bacterium]